MTETYLITGGLGYIGSHICVELFHNLFATKRLSSIKLLILDNLSNCSPKVIFLNGNNHLKNFFLFLRRSWIGFTRS